MLLWLTQYLAQYVSGFSVFEYLTFRTMVSVITAPSRTCRRPARRPWAAR